MALNSCAAVTFMLTVPPPKKSAKACCHGRYSKVTDGRAVSGFSWHCWLRALTGAGSRHGRSW